MIFVSWFLHVKGRGAYVAYLFYYFRFVLWCACRFTCCLVFCVFTFAIYLPALFRAHAPPGLWREWSLVGFTRPYNQLHGHTTNSYTRCMSDLYNFICWQALLGRVIRNLLIIQNVANKRTSGHPDHESGSACAGKSAGEYTNGCHPFDIEKVNVRKLDIY